MTVLCQSVEVCRPVAEVFAYVSDFTTTQEWDATVQRSRQLSEGPIDVGTCFEVTCLLPVGSITLIYEVSAFERNQLFEQRVRSRLFEIQDSIRVLLHFDSGFEVRTCRYPGHIGLQVRHFVANAAQSVAHKAGVPQHNIRGRKVAC